MSEALIANTLRKHKPLFLCTYIYVSLTFIVFCKTTSRNLHTWHFKSQERRTRHSARIEPKKKHANSVFNHARYSKVIQRFHFPDSGYWIQDSLSGKLGFRRLCDPSLIDVATKILRLLVQYALKGQEPKQPVGNSWEFLVI